MGIDIVRVRDDILLLAEQHVSSDKMYSFYSLLTGTYTISGGLGFPKAHCFVWPFRGSLVIALGIATLQAVSNPSLRAWLRCCASRVATEGNGTTYRHSNRKASEGHLLCEQRPSITVLAALYRTRSVPIFHQPDGRWTGANRYGLFASTQ